MSVKEFFGNKSLVMRKIKFFSIVLALGFLFLYRAPVAEAFLLDATDQIGNLNADGSPNYTGYDDTLLTDYPGFNKPQSTLIDTADHRLFVSDSGNSRVQVYNLDANNNLIDRIPDYALGVGPGATQNTTRMPHGLAYDNIGKRLFVSDTTNHRVMVFDVAVIDAGENAVAVLGQLNYTTGAAAAAGATKLRNPTDLVYDGSRATKLLYVSDTGFHRVMVFDVTAIVNGEAAVNVLGQTLFTGSASATAVNRLKTPDGLEIDAGGQRLFVADSGNNRVMVFDVASVTNGENAVKVLGQVNFTTGVFGTGSDRLYNSLGVSYDSSRQYLFVSDRNNCRTQVFDVSSIDNGEESIGSVGADEDYFCIVSDSYNVANQILSEHVEYDPTSQKLYVSDTSKHRLMIFDASEINANSAVDMLGQTNADGSPAWGKKTINNIDLSVTLKEPEHSIMDSVKHRLYVSDSDNGRVLVFNLNSSNELVDRRADFVLGQADLQSNIVYNQNVVTGRNISRPTGLALDLYGQRLFVADHDLNRVLVFDVSEISNYESAVFVIGANSLSSFGDRFMQPVGLAYDREYQRLFVASQDHFVMAFDLSPNTMFLGENAIGILGTGSAGLTPNNVLWPVGIAYDEKNQRLFVADDGNSRVMVFNVSDIQAGEEAINVLGQSSFVVEISGNTQSLIQSPQGLVYDNDTGILFLGDYLNGRVLLFDTNSIDDGEPAVNVLGQATFTAGGGGFTSRSGFIAPRGLYLDAFSKKLVLTDNSADRVMIFSLPNITMSALVPLTVGVPYNSSVSVSGGTAPYTCSIADGSLPDGLVLNADCTITGTPTEDFGLVSIRAVDSTLTAPANQGIPTVKSFGTVDHFTISASSVRSAGDDNSNGMIAVSTDGVTIDTSYNGPHEIIFSGASDSINNNSPICKDINGAPIPFGVPVTLEFVQGIAVFNMQLFNNESAVIHITDGVIDSTGYDLQVEVETANLSAVLSQVSVSPSPAMAGDNVEVTATLIDDAGNFYTPGFDAYGNPRPEMPPLDFYAYGANNPETLIPTDFGDGIYKASYSTLNGGTDFVSVQVDYRNLQSNQLAGSDGSVIVKVNSILDHLKIDGVDPFVAGQSQAISITAVNTLGGTYAYAFNDPVLKTVTLSGAQDALTGERPTCTDSIGQNINLDEPMTISFSESNANCNLTLYRSGAADINISDGSHDSLGSTDFALHSNTAPESSDLDLSVSTFTVSPSPAMLNQPANILITAQNFSAEPYLGDIFGNPTVVNTTLSRDSVAVTTTIAESNGDGTYTSVYIPGIFGTDQITAQINSTALTLDEDGTSDGIFNLEVGLATTTDPATHFAISGTLATDTLVAGQSLIISISAKAESGATSVVYAGDQSVIFSGANQASTGEYATCEDKNGLPVNFGSATVLNFVEGVATCTLKLYTAETATINVHDVTINSAGFAHDVVVSAGVSTLSPQHSSVSVSKSPAGQNDVITITVTTMDSLDQIISAPHDIYGNTLPDELVVAINVAGDNPGAVAVTNNNDGTYSGSYTTANLGSDTITATIDGNAVGADTDGVSDGTYHLIINGSDYIPGDFDHNDVVNIFDFNTLLSNFGINECANIADIDGNCRVDIFDYSIFIGNFGMSRI